MVERLRLGLCGRWSGEGSLNVCWGRGIREKMDFLGNGATQIIERLADIGRVVVSFVRVLGPDVFVIKTSGL